MKSGNKAAYIPPATLKEMEKFFSEKSHPRILAEQKEVIELRELKLRKDTGMKLLAKAELLRVLDTTLEFSPNRALSVEFIYNVDLGSLSINFIQNEETVFWYLFQDDKLNQPRLNQLKNSIAGGY